MSLAGIKRHVAGPPRVVIYGVPGIGKTSVAACFPKPIFDPVEMGLGQLAVDAFPQPQSYSDVCIHIQALLDEPHDYETYVLDGLDALEPMLWQHVCQTVRTDKGSQAQNIHSYGFHKGFDHARAEWANLLAGLDMLGKQRGMLVVLLAHSIVTHFDAPDTDPYDKFAVAIEKKSEPLLRGWADATFFLNYRVTAVDSEGRRDDRKRGVGKGERICHTVDRPAWFAKNRYRLPHEIPIPENRPEVVWQTLAAALAASQPTVSAQPATNNQNSN